jgi:hypothetical protein
MQPCSLVQQLFLSLTTQTSQEFDPNLIEGIKYLNSVEGHNGNETPPKALPKEEQDATADSFIGG